ncbi:MAG: serine/threonine-protein kinase [Lentisphaeria bacterium]|nr:serine/threonine-protein kinase [Lentisphaeria bacterium]
MNNDATKEPSGGDLKTHPPPAETIGDSDALEETLTLGESMMVDGLSKRVIGERYHIVREIGRGGMGIVYLAQDTRLNRFVAIKRLLVQSSKSKQIQRRFLREAQTIASLGHFHIVSIFDIGQDEYDYYIVMEYVPGPEILDNNPPVVPTPPVSLDQYIKIRGPLEPDEARQLIVKLCHALDYAHEQGTIHRDIKPSNILLDGNLEPKLVDFGLARPVEKGPTEEITHHGTLLGTPEYVAPEQWSDAANVDTRVDIFALGAVFWYIMTAELPRYFRESAVREDISRPLAKALSYKRPNRYAKMSEFVRDLEATMDHASPTPGIDTPDAGSSAGQWQCPHCEKSNLEQATYCAYCGAKGVADCPVCEAEYHIGVQFCPDCGSDIKLAESSVTVIQTARSQADFLEFESAVETLKVFVSQNQPEAAELTRKWREIILERRNRIMDLDAAMRVRNLEKAVSLAEHLRQLVPEESLSESPDFEVVVNFNTNIAELRTMLTEAAKQAQAEYDLEKLTMYINYLNRVFGESACTSINSDLKMTRNALDHAVTQAGLFIGMNCFSHAMQILEDSPPWRGTKLGDRRTTMSEHCRALTTTREESIDNIEKYTRDGKYSDALLQIMDMGHFRLPPNNSEIRPAAADQEAHNRIMRIDKGLTETIEDTIPEWIHNDRWSNVIDAQNALRFGHSNAWKHLSDILQRAVNNEVAHRYNTAVELETGARFPAAGEAWHRFLAIPQSLILPKLLQFANEFPGRVKIYNRGHRDEIVKRITIGLLLLWVYPAFSAVRTAATLDANIQSKIHHLLPGTTNGLAFVVVIFMVHSGKLKTFDSLRRFAQYSPQLNIAGLLVALSPMAYCISSLSILGGKMLTILNNPAIPYLVTMAAWLAFDLTRQKTFRLPASLGLTIAWIPIMIVLLIAHSLFENHRYLWPVVAMVHGLLYAILVFITSAIHRTPDEQAEPEAASTA